VVYIFRVTLIIFGGEGEQWVNSQTGCRAYAVGPSHRTKYVRRDRLVG
jgi:hypothetical protein